MQKVRGDGGKEPKAENGKGERGELCKRAASASSSFLYQPSSLPRDDTWAEKENKAVTRLAHGEAGSKGRVQPWLAGRRRAPRAGRELGKGLGE